MNLGYEQHIDRVKARCCELQSKLAHLYPERTKLTLEIGCGHGHWLVDYAKAFPEKDCLGIDLMRDRIERAERKRDRANVGNLQFLKGEAFEVVDLLPLHVRVAEVFILFSDPWPKKRHWKNRIFCHDFLQELAKRCDADVLCYFRTDHEPYFDWALEVVDNQKLWTRQVVQHWPFERETIFQTRAEAYRSLVISRR